MIRSNIAAGPTGLPIDDLFAVLSALPGFDRIAAAAADHHQKELAGAPHQRGRLAELAVWLAGWQASSQPSARRVEVAVFAGAHGWLSGPAFARAHAALKQRLLLLSSGGAGASVIGGAAQAGLRVFDLAIDQPTHKAPGRPAMSDAACMRALAFGMEAVNKPADILCITASGVGGRESAAALALALFGGRAADWIAGTAPSLAVPFPEAAATVQSLAGAVPANGDALDLVRQIGGREIAAAMGAIMAARSQRVPVILEGFEATMAAGVLSKLAPGSIDHCLVAAREGSAAHDHLIDHLGFDPILDLGITDGDGIAALLAGEVLRLAVAIHAGSATRAQLNGLLSDELVMQ